MVKFDFSRKLDEFKSKSDEEILQYLSEYWGIKPDEHGVFSLVARYEKSEKLDRNGNEYAMFIDVRNSIGDILYYPFRLGKVAIWTNCNSKYENQDYWQINVKLSHIIRHREENPFRLEMANKTVGLPSLKYKDRLEKEKLIKKIFEETGSSERDARNTSNALRAIMGDLYTEPERFVFELLQNADDQPEQGIMVDVKLKTLNEYLFFLHSGKQFSTEDVESISSIGDSTKKNDSEKTGYKGIGFKSVFSDAETVFINSGNFSFAFDKYSPVYPVFADMNEIPWQIKPIWEEKYRLPKEVQNVEEFFNSRVAIALHVGTDNIKSYIHIIPKLMSQPRFVLFLRNIGKIVFEDKKAANIEIKKSIFDSTIQISSNDVTENWIVKDYLIQIPQETRDEIQNEKLIPPKLKKSTLTKITFAAKVHDGKIVPVNNSVLFTYLPTKVNEFEFPFLVNADFLTTASRESLHLKNIWNRFLFSQIGEWLVEWAKTLTEYEEALCILPTKKFEENNILGCDFQNTYKNALAKKSFIKGHKGDILPQDKIIIDDTRLSEIIGKELFCEILGKGKQLPYRESDSIILKTVLYEEIEIVNLIELKKCLVGYKKLGIWYMDVGEEVRRIFNKWLIDNNFEEIIKSLPLFCYSGVWKSYNSIREDANYILLSESLSCIKDLLDNLKFKCPDTYIESNPFIDYINKTNEENLFNEIVKRARNFTLSANEKLLIVTTKFEGVDLKKIEQVVLFCNDCGEAKALANMVAYRENAPIWLKSYMISKNEYSEELSRFLIQDKEVYSKIIEKYIDEIRRKISLKELYLQYKNLWTLQFTMDIIKRSDFSEDILGFVEQQNNEAKAFFLQRIPRLRIDIDKTYEESDYNCRILRLAFDVFGDDEQMRSFASKVYVDNQRSIAYFTFSDDVSFEYHKDLYINMKLSDLLPDFNEPNMVQRIKECFSVFKASEIERLLLLVPMPVEQISYRMFRMKSRDTFTPAQFLFGLYYTRCVKKYYNNYVPSIDLSSKTEDWVNSLLDILYDQKIRLFDDSFGYRLSPYFDKYFSSEYLNDDEIILPAIEKWADNEDKRSYLSDFLEVKGVKNEPRLIQLRKFIINNESMGETMVDGQKKNIDSTIELFNKKHCLPFVLENQISVMRLFQQHSQNIISKIDIEVLVSSSTEYKLPEYLSWKTNDMISIFLYKKEMPRKLIFTKENDLLLCKYVEGNYYYEPSNKTLYINSEFEIKDILFSVITDEQIPFNTNDWHILYYDNLVSKSEVESKNKQILDLKIELEKYKIMVNSLKENNDNRNNSFISNNEEMKHEKENNAEVNEYGKDADEDAIDEDTRMSINHDARIAAKIYLESFSDYDCTAWNPEESSQLICGLVKYKGKPINIAITSSKSRKLYLHPRVFAEIMGNPYNLLLNYGADNRIHSLSFSDVFRDNPNVNLIFDTDFVSPEHIAELANKCMVYKRTRFVIENPKYSSSDTIQSFGLNEKKEDGSVSVDFSDRDIFDY